MKRAILVATMILLFGSASLAAAECAWVLWKKEVPHAFSSSGSTDVSSARPATPTAGPTSQTSLRNIERPGPQRGAFAYQEAQKG